MEALFGEQELKRGGTHLLLSFRRRPRADGGEWPEKGCRMQNLLQRPVTQISEEGEGRVDDKGVVVEGRGGP